MKKYLSLALCVFVLTATANTVHAFDKKDLAKLKKTQRIGIAKCIKCNLGGAILKKTDLIGADLRKANLIKANLTKADIYKANLTGAILGGANLTKADLSGANLTKANLYKANLTGANLYGVNLIKADLRKANLTGANLYGANLTGANLTKADLSGATWTDGIKCGKGSIGKCVRDKWKPIMGMRHPSRPCMKVNSCGVDRRSAAEKRKNPYDIRGK